jgi:Tol biopolymer transport system component
MVMETETTLLRTKRRLNILLNGYNPSYPKTVPFMAIRDPFFHALVIAIGVISPASIFAQTTERISQTPDGVGGNKGSMDHPSISANGRYVAFSSDADNLVPGDLNGHADVFVHDRLTGMNELVSKGVTGAGGNDDSSGASISADGRFVAFISGATNLVPGDMNGDNDIFVFDRQVGTLERVNLSSTGQSGDGNCWDAPSISADGRFVLFMTDSSNLVPGRFDDSYKVLVRDRDLGTTERVSVSISGAAANLDAYGSSISADGRFVTFDTFAYNLVPGDTNGNKDVFIRDRQNRWTNIISLESTQNQSNDDSSGSLISANGQFVVFVSKASNLVLGDTNGKTDVFVHDQETQTLMRISVNANGVGGNGDSYFPSISSDGRFISYTSYADNLVMADFNGKKDIFIYDQHLDQTTRASVDSFGVEGNDLCETSNLNASGRFIAFSSSADNLIPNDTNGAWDVFVRDQGYQAEGNTIILAGPYLAAAKSAIKLSWYGAPPNSRYALVASLERTGTIWHGHEFDLGAPYTVLATGANSQAGNGNYSLSYIPISGSGYSVYFEIVTRDASGKYFDSTVKSIRIN